MVVVEGVVWWWRCGGGGGCSGGGGGGGLVPRLVMSVSTNRKMVMLIYNDLIRTRVSDNFVSVNINS